MTEVTTTEATIEITGWVEKVTEKAIQVRLSDEWDDKSGTVIWLPKSLIIDDRDGYRTGSVVITLPIWFIRKNNVPAIGRPTSRRSFPQAIT